MVNGALVEDLDRSVWAGVNGALEEDLDRSVLAGHRRGSRRHHPGTDERRRTEWNRGIYVYGELYMSSWLRTPSGMRSFIYPTHAPKPSPLPLPPAQSAVR